MYTAFDSPYPHIPNAAFPVQRKRSPNFLKSVKHLVKRPSRSGLEAPKEDTWTLRSRSTSELGQHPRQWSHSPTPRFHTRTWGGSSARTRKGQRSREQVPSMIEYLTLAQLENVWYKQDSYKGTVSRLSPLPVRRSSTCNSDSGEIEKSLVGRHWMPTPRFGQGACRLMILHGQGPLHIGAESSRFWGAKSPKDKICCGTIRHH